MYVPPSHLSSFTTALPNLDGWENSEVGALEDALGSWIGFKARLLVVVPFNSEKNLLKLVTLDWSVWAASWAMLRPSLSGSVWNLHRRKELNKENLNFPGQLRGQTNKETSDLRCSILKTKELALTAQWNQVVGTFEALNTVEWWPTVEGRILWSPLCKSYPSVPLQILIY